MPRFLDEKSRRSIEDLEKRSGRPSGLGRLDRDECPLNMHGATACFFCSCGHMTVCHHPLTCEEADCTHRLEEHETEMRRPG
ncbi:MAG: hypothetical protein A2Z70_01285 [Chloroflexi bacterium RBG_13_48_17]|nr:MAG: hypothetical protein A2Z70_01285 [Chloroflexi bacterium RBG_13_48_17]